ncbi:site-specific integrase [Anaerospora hongkongensis]|uniref:tyrosine-type recombinase/integrase n=1 Tax=Anaerospora hongkongensis TaxID=244830 RepID=UPI002FDB4C82
MAKGRAANNDGSIYYDKDTGGCRVQLTAPDGSRIGKRFKDIDEAVKWKNAQISDFNKGKYVAPSKMTFKEWRTQWIEDYIKPKRKVRTWEDYESHLNNHTAIIDNVLMQEILPYHVTQVYNAMRKKKLSESTVLKLHSILHNCFKQARINKIILLNPVEDVDRPVALKPKIKTFDENEIKKFLKTAEGHRIYAGIYIIAHTAVRLGEVLGIRWKEDIKWTEGKIKVQQEIIRSKSKKLSPDSPKTENSVREFYAGENVFDVLRAERQRQLADEDLCNSEYVVCNNKGTPMEPRRFKKEFDEIREKAGLPHLTRRALRHSVASILVDKNVPIPDVSALLGHADHAFTFKTYVHANKNATKKSAATISKALSDKKKPSKTQKKKQPQ